MRFVDSHCHLDRIDLAPFEGDLAHLITASGLDGVQRFLGVGLNRDNCQTVIQQAERYPEVFASVGIHPNEAQGSGFTVDELVALGRHPRVVAIGETGLDFFRSQGDLEWQRQRFRKHIQAAIAAQLPLIIHSREARAETLKIMAEEGVEQVGGVMHCFVEDQATADAAIAMGCYISFSGIVTFNSAKELQQVAAMIPLDRLLIETDAPYLAPAPFRGRPNQPAYVRLVAEKIAVLRGVDLEEVAAASWDNFERLFKIGSSAVLEGG